MFIYELFEEGGKTVPTNESTLRDKEDYDAKSKALQDIQLDPNTAKDPKLQDELKYRKSALEKEAKAKGIKQ